MLMPASIPYRACNGFICKIKKDSCKPAGPIAYGDTIQPVPSDVSVNDDVRIGQRPSS
jgi:hypothetical protein